MRRGVMPQACAGQPGCDAFIRQHALSALVDHQADEAAVHHGGGLAWAEIIDADGEVTELRFDAEWDVMLWPTSGGV